MINIIHYSLFIIIIIIIIQNNNLSGFILLEYWEIISINIIVY